MSRLILVVFWVMLQVVAPLTHAHANQNSGSSGLHIPGLEFYSTIKEVGFSAPDIEFSSGVLVTVNSGVKLTRIDLKDVTSPQAIDYCLLDDTLLQTRFIPFVEIDFSTYAPPLIYKVPPNLHRTRAPPAQSIVL